MTGLMDIVPLTKQVTVGNQQIEVNGISALGLAQLMTDFPELQQMMEGKDIELTPARLIELFPEAVAGILAAGTGKPGDKQVQKHATTLPVGVQLDLLIAILDLSIPGGLGPFVQNLAVLASAVGLQMPGGDTDTSGKDQDTN